MNEGKKQLSLVSKVLLIFLFILVIIASAMYLIILKRSEIKFELLGNKNIILELGNNYEEEGFVAFDNKRDISSKVQISSNIDINKLGNYQIVYNLKIPYLLIDENLTRNIIVTETVKPEIKINSKETVVLEVGDKFTYPTYTAIDNYDGDITENVKVETNLNTKKIGQYKINYMVSDSSGNETTSTITVKVQKKKNPYIVVSISEQTLRYYEYDKLVLTSKVVTGIDGKTPTGKFKVLNKARDIVLRGADYASFVSYWIAFKGNSFGFHDASWRSSFGGNIYKYGGSHGCVNMPYSKVKQLYNLVSIGTPVYINK